MKDNRLYNITSLLPMLESAITVHNRTLPVQKNKLTHPNLKFEFSGMVDILENELSFNHQTWKEWSVSEQSDLFKALRFANDIVATFNTYDLRYSNETFKARQPDYLHFVKLCEN